MGTEHTRSFTGVRILIFLSLICCIIFAETNYEWESLSEDLPYEYLFSEDRSTTILVSLRKSWYEARRWCREKGGGDLLTITSELEVLQFQR